MKIAVKKVPPNVAKDVRAIDKGDKKLDHPYYQVEKRKGTGKATCRQCDTLIDEGEPTLYFHYAPEDDNTWIRTRGTIHADDCEGGKDEWTKCPKCRKQIPRADWSAHWAKEKGKRAASKRVTAGTPIQDWHMMEPDEDEKRFTIKPLEIPRPQEVPVPVKEPVKEPEKVPAHTGQKSEDNEFPGEVTSEGKVIGYKYFNLAKDEENNWRLSSPAQQSTPPWPKGEVTALCGNGRDHTAPGPKDCNCGIHMCHSEDSPTLQHYKESGWLARLEGWGEEDEHGNGGVATGSLGPDVIRAQHVQVVGIRPPLCEQCDKPATHLISARPDTASGRPSCEDHMPETISNGKIKIHATPIHEIAQKVSDYYGGLAVKDVGEPWEDDSDPFDQFEKQFKSSSMVVVRSSLDQDDDEPWEACVDCGGNGKDKGLYDHICDTHGGAKVGPGKCTVHGLQPGECAFSSKKGQECDNCRGTGLMPANTTCPCGHAPDDHGITRGGCMSCMAGGRPTGGCETCEGEGVDEDGEECPDCEGSGFDDDVAFDPEDDHKYLCQMYRGGNSFFSRKTAHCGQCDEDYDDSKTHKHKTYKEWEKEELELIERNPANNVGPYKRAAQGLDPTAQPGNSTSMGDDPQKIKPRVDPYTTDKIEDANKKQLDQEARKLQRGMKSLDQFAGFKQVRLAGVEWNKEAMEFLTGFWHDHPDLRKKCKEKYGYDPVDDPEDYWVPGLREEPEHKALWNKSKEDTLTLTDAKRWSKAELEANKEKTASWKRVGEVKISARVRNWWGNDDYFVCGDCEGTGRSSWRGGKNCGSCNGSGLDRTPPMAPDIPTARGLRPWTGVNGGGFPKLKSWERDDDVRERFNDILDRYKGNNYIVGIGNNTGLHEDKDQYHVRLHETDILSFHKTKPEVTVNVSNWNTNTTLHRVNQWLPQGFSIGNEEVGSKEHALTLRTPTKTFKVPRSTSMYGYGSRTYRPVTVNTETGEGVDIPDDHELVKCDKCGRSRTQEAMPNHQRRHEQYQKAFDKNPWKVCGDCQGQGCANCKGTGILPKRRIQR